MANGINSSLQVALKKFYLILKPDKRDVSSMYMFAILSGLVQLSLPLGIQAIMGFVLASSVSTSIIVLIILVLIGTFINGLLQIRLLEITEKLKQKIFLRYAFEYCNKIPKLNLLTIDQYYLPDLVNRFFETVSIQKGIEKILLDLPAALIQIFLGLLLLSFYHPLFIAFGLILMLFVGFILWITFPQGLNRAMEASSYKYQIVAWLEEMARLIKSFKYSNENSVGVHRTDDLVNGYLSARTSYFKTLLIQFWSLISFKVVITASMLIMGSLLLVKQQINVGQFVASEIIIITVISSVEKLIISLDKIYDTLVSIEKLRTITDAEVEKSGSMIFETPSTAKGLDIKFEEVSFIYPDGKVALKNINLEIHAGEVIKFSGPSSAGKSTLIELLMGSYSNFTGRILLDHIPIGNYDLSSLRAQIGILIHHQDLFHGTILDNITFGNPNIRMEEILAMAQKLGLLAFIQSEKEGFNTALDPTGKRIPKKYKQMILIMRVLLLKPKLILLEEPLLNLEADAEASFFALLKEQAGATILITSIEDRDSFIYDKKYSLVQGQIVE